MRTMITSLAVAAVATALTAGGGAWAAGPQNQCFRSSDYQGFKPVDEHAFIIRTTPAEYFGIEVQDACPELTRPAAGLVTVVRGSDLICGPLDWDLRVGQLGPGGFTVGCIVKSQRRLTKAEVAALPPSQKP